MEIELDKKYRLKEDRNFEFALCDGTEGYFCLKAGHHVTAIAEVDTDSLRSVVCEATIDGIDDTGLALCGHHILEEIGE